MTSLTKDTIDYLLSSQSIRERCQQIYQKALANEALHFQIAEEHWQKVVSYVDRDIKHHYPDGKVPYHSRWRHLEMNGNPLYEDLLLPIEDGKEKARISFALIITSILLDAGAGPHWSFTFAGTPYQRSEGLALAAYTMFRSGLFSNDPSKPYQCDSEALLNLSLEDMREAMQITKDNPLAGLEGRFQILKRLARVLASHPDFSKPSLGYFFDILLAKSKDQKIAAADILNTVLKVFSDIWPDGLKIGNVHLGDVWHHPLIKGLEPNDQYVPFHKLSQWLTYSLFEPLEQYGLRIQGMSDLTGLAEYRNGGLFIDLGVLRPLKPDFFQHSYTPLDGEIVEWRALTICLLDRLAKDCRAIDLPLDQKLPALLQGGSWSAGRKIALEKRGDLSPPIKVDSKGTIF